MKNLRVALVMALALAVPSARAADFPEGAKNRFQFELGGAWDSFDTEARLDVTRDGIASAGATIDFEKLLDVPVMEQHFRGGKTGEYLHAQRFGLLAHPAHHVAEADHVVAVVLETFGQQRRRNLERTGFTEDHETVFADRRIERRVFFLPVRN